MESIKESKNEFIKDKVLLMLLPFWTPLIPPAGISSIKSYLGRHGYSVSTYDANSIPELWELHHVYLETLKKYIPVNKRGNYYNIGHNVLRNNLMAYINRTGREDYTELVRRVVYNHYYTRIGSEQISELDGIVGLFFARLEKFLIDTVEREKPAVFGLTAYSGSLPSSVFAFRLIKEKYPHIKTVMGGGIFSDQLPIGSPDLEYLLEKTPFIDKFIIGQGEKIFLRYMQSRLPENQRIYTKEDINGETVGFEEEGLPDYSDHNLRNYPYIGATGSSSCPYQCSFCNVVKYWGPFRKKEVAMTVSQMMTLYKRYGKQLFFLTDSLLNPIIDQLSNEFSRCELSLYWDGYLRVAPEVCDREKTMLWRQGGFYRARLGIESGSQHVLDMMGKNINPGMSKASLVSLASAGIKTTAYCVIGHPGETEEDFRKTLDFVEESADYIWEAECNPFGFYYSGQSKSDEWAGERMLLYPESTRDMLLSQSWILNCEPSREVIYDRVFRFTEHCGKLGIPNPYSMQEVYLADERWKKLHENAVPAMIEFTGDVYINENKNVSRIVPAHSVFANTGDFAF